MSTHLSIEMLSALSPNPIVIKLPSVFLANICVHSCTAPILVNSRVPKSVSLNSGS